MVLGALLHWRMYRMSATRIGDGGEDATGDDVALNPSEPQLDLVEPGRVSRSEVQADIGVPIQKRADLLGLVCRQVVGNHVDLLGRWLVDDDVCQKRDKLRRSVPRRSFAEHFAGF